MTKHFKYPKTLHLPWSESVQNDDKIHSILSQFENRTVIITEKLDGENTSMYFDHIHARSIDSKNHESRNWVKNYWGSISNQIPVGWRICGENMFAKHSIKYENLDSYFYGFSIWDDKNVCLSWQDTIEIFNQLKIVSVPVLYLGLYNEEKIRRININSNICEGYVLRITDSFNYSEFKKYVGKYVRKSHVQTKKHWMHQKIEQNKLKV